ncbi:MAG: hypothetical protein WCO35_02160 [Candidatus Nomurabacteria bacterium]
MEENLSKAKEILNKSFLLNEQSRIEALQKGEKVMTREDMEFLMSFKINLYPFRSFGRLHEVTNFNDQDLKDILETEKKKYSLIDFSETYFSEENKKILEEENCIVVNFKKPFQKYIVFFSEEAYIKYLIQQFQELISHLGSVLD